MLEDFMRLHTLLGIGGFLVFLAGIKWWNNGQSKPFNILYIIGTTLFIIVVALRVIAEFSN